MRKRIVKKCLVYACVGALAITNLPVASLPVAQVNAAEVLGAEVALQLAQDGVDKIGPQSVSGGYAYQGGFSIPEGVTEDYKYLEITYVGDITSLRLQGASTTWFAENAEGTFKTVDGSDIVLNAETETTVVIDLEKTGVSYVGGDFVHLHAGNGTDFTYEFKSVKLRKATTASAPVEEEKSVALQLAQDGVDKVGPQLVSGGYAYQGGFSIPEGVTEDYKYLQITYVGDITSLRLQGASTTWFAENAEGTFETVDGSDIVLNTTTETTVVIDLEKTGVSYVGGDFVHLHAGNGTDFTYEFKSVYLKTTSTVTTEEPTSEGPTSEEPTSEEPTSEEPTAEGPTSDVSTPVEGKSVALQLGQDGVDKVGPQSVSGGYAYQGGFSIPEGITEDYKYLQITYVGDITSLRLQGASTTWFAENAEGTFKTVDGSDIVLNTTTETTVVIDLEKTGVSYVGGDFIHLHAGNGTDFTYEFKSVYLKTTPSASTSESAPTPSETVAPSETATPEPTTAADPSTGIKLDGDENGASSMNGTFTIPKRSEALKEKDEPAYKYLGYVTFKDLATADFKYLKFTYTGDISGLRFEFNQMPGNVLNPNGPCWFDSEQAYHFVTEDGSAIPLVGNNTTVVIDLEKSGIDMSKYNAGFHMHGQSLDTDVSIVIKDAVLYGGTPTPKPTVAPTTQAPTTTKVTKPGKVKVKKATKTKGSKKVKITWKKIKKATGYKVQVSTKKKKFTKKTIVVKKNIKKNKVSITLNNKKLKKNRKYYVRVRAYKTVNGKKYYGKWSKVKRVTVKK